MISRKSNVIDFWKSQINVSRKSNTGETKTKNKPREDASRKASAVPVAEDNEIFLMLSSYAEKFKKDIQTVIADEKKANCANNELSKVYLKTYSFKLHFATEKTLKHWLFGQRYKIKK